MTIEQWVKDYLYNCGMFEDQCEQVVELMKADSANNVMSDRWDDEIDGYPVQMKSVLMLAVKRSGLQWVDENAPDAWFRAMFE